ncbi:HAD family hydrolase [Luteolibacter sp. LG18]|uniref:HAD family hydrolase n=1 Tax=Luteolibacter sp. LG18 TaxID=2819286 RepID=UPI002B2DB02E|nr:haloacid dehalogenase [Luteolibacter sp. LG18]
MADLWLFDIDGTLVDTGGAGMRALQEAATLCFGGEGPPLDLAGSTDLGVVYGILEHFGLEPEDEAIDSFFRTYLERLEWNLAHGGYPGRVLPGVVALLERLHADESVHLGLLTGNIAGGAAAKMRHYGLDRFFPFGAYGCDHADRNLLGPVAAERAANHTGRSFTPDEIVVVGDTPKDIACAKALGAPCIAVATGKFTADELRAHGAERVVETLEEVQ